MKITAYILYGISVLSLASCHTDWLDIKRDKKQVVPGTLKDLEAIIGNSQVMTERMPYLGEVASGDFLLSGQQVTSVDETIRGTYLWTDEQYGSLPVIDWNNRHEQIFYANTALAGLDGLSDYADTEQWRRIKGSALFYRAWAIYQLAQLFCKPYHPPSADTDPGIPFLLEADINLRAARGTVRQTYDRIVMDLEQAMPLLPERPAVKTRPGKAAAYGLLARTYLLMGQYEEAVLCVDNAFGIDNTLIDYNTLDTNSLSPFERFNDEVVFRSVIIGSYVLVPPYFSTDPALHLSYSPHDLRKPLYFESSGPQIGFKGSYDGGSIMFCGIATDELHFIQAECLARLGHTERALEVLNRVLRHRYETGTFQPHIPMPTDELVRLVIEERRKSLCFRGLRWTDLRRLSLDSENSIRLQREVNGRAYELSPDKPNYVMYIPENEILLNPMEQNVRH